MNEAFKAVQVADKVHWVGAIDWDVRNFHGYLTSRGTTYNAYLVLAEKPVLIDTVNRLRRAGMPKLDAVVRGGHIRLRPILMTTLTTILGLLPMALSWGEGAELRSPLAITVASGLALSTLLTLVVIPAAYLAVPSRIDRQD